MPQICSTHCNPALQTPPTVATPTIATPTPVGDVQGQRLPGDGLEGLVQAGDQLDEVVTDQQEVTLGPHCGDLWGKQGVSPAGDPLSPPGPPPQVPP